MTGEARLTERYVRVSGEGLWLWCPGCTDTHRIVIDGPMAWQWNGDTTRPTITPSIRVSGVQWAPDQAFHKPRHHVADGEQIICHSFVTDGQWRFLADCTHDLAGQEVPLAPLPDGLDDDA